MNHDELLTTRVEAEQSLHAGGPAELQRFVAQGGVPRGRTAALLELLFNEIESYRAVRDAASAMLKLGGYPSAEQFNSAVDRLNAALADCQRATREEPQP